MDSQLIETFKVLKTLRYEDVTKRCKDIFQLLDGEIFYSLSLWLKEIKIRFWEKPLSEIDTFPIYLFLYGNGCSKNVIKKWIITSL